MNMSHVIYLAHETYKFLLPRRDAKASQAGVPKDRNANERIHPACNRGGLKEGKAVRAKPKKWVFEKDGIWHKVCRDCMEVKPANNEHYSINKGGRLGLQPKCKVCLRVSYKKWYDSGTGSEYAKNYRQENAAKLAKLNKDWRDRNTEIIRQQKADYRQKNKEQIALAEKRKKEKNPEVYLEIQRRWRKANSGKVAYRIRNAVHVKFHATLRNGKNGESWVRVFGYSFAELLTHLERQFTKDMNWDNYGSHWHIDHITPISAFDFSEDKDKVMRECWGLPNLRPLRAIENIRKHASITHLI